MSPVLRNMNAHTERRRLWQNQSMRRPFAATVWREGNWFVSPCLDLDFASQGETEEEALANLREATDLYLESFPQTFKKPAAIRTFEAHA